MVNGVHGKPGAHTDPLKPERLGGPAPDMLSVDEAMERIAATFAPLAERVRVPILEALDRVLAEDVAADIDLPPFDNSAMDGYAVRAADVRGASAIRPASLHVVAEIAAGRVAGRGIGPGQACRILTGAPLPEGADSVVPYEYTDGRGFGGWTGEAGRRAARGEKEVLVYRPVAFGENVRYAGEEQRKGDVLLRDGTVIRPPEVAALAALGRSQVWVYCRPRVAILSTGDELVPPDAIPGPGQIRDTNSYALAALVQRYGGVPLRLGIAADRPDALRARLAEAVAQRVSLILTSGGVSMGDYDVVKHVLQQDGDIRFWSIDVRPGKPLAFARFRGVPLIGLPGNPVSAMVTFELFARPAVLRLAGHAHWQKVELWATTLQPLANRGGREHFMRAVVERRPSAGGKDEGEGEWFVRLAGEQGSHMLTSLVNANALIRVPRGQTQIEPGARVRVVMLDWPPLSHA